MQSRLDRLAKAIEARAGDDQRLLDESAHVDSLRERGAGELHMICRQFIDELNTRLKEPALLLDPPAWMPENFIDPGPNFFQISLRGRLLQIEFAATEELYSTEDFRRRYVLRGGVRSFNQDLLEHDTVDEQLIFYCPEEDGPGATWFFFDARTYRSGPLSLDYLANELERLL